MAQVTTEVKALQRRAFYLTGVLISILFDMTTGFRKSWLARIAALQAAGILKTAFESSRHVGNETWSKLTGFLGPCKRAKYCSSTWGDPACKPWHQRHGPSDGAVWHCIYACSSMNNAKARC